MTPTELRNQRLGQKMIKHLERRHFDAYYCATGKEATEKVIQLIPDGSSVTWGGTMTIRNLGIPELLKQRGTLDVWDRDTVETPEEKQDMAAITWGPKHVIFVIGMNKVTQDAEAALKRARSTASPINAARSDINTPCQIDGQCHNCNSPQSICNYIHFLRNSSKPGRIIVILVGETLGY